MNIPNWIARCGAITGLCLLMTTAALGQQTTFKIGQPAPEFKAGRWVKGPPVSDLKPGQIYVLEFWATWCGPCREAMPHLSELARKHAGKVTFIGVDILERGPADKVDREVDKFVEQMGRDLDYPVCRDTADDHLHRLWFTPTRAPGIPVTVVVDGQGRIAWIGHPRKGLDETLDQLLAGTFDYGKSAAEFAKGSGDNQAMMKVYTEYNEAVRNRDWAKALAIVDDNSQFAASMWFMRYQALLRLDAPQAFIQVKEAVAKQDGKAPNLLSAIAEADGLPAGMYQFALENLTGDNSVFGLTVRAKLAYRLGDAAKAVEYQLKVRDLVMNKPTKPPAKILENIEADLKKYQGQQ